MSNLFLEKLGLEKKPKPKTYKPVEIINKEGIQIEADIIDKTNELTFNIDDFRLRIKKKGLTVPASSAKVIDKTDKTDEKKQLLKPEKIKTKIKLPGALSSELKKKSHKKRKPKIKEEELILDIPATLIEINGKPIGDRLPSPMPNINIKAPAYYMNNRAIFVNFINSLFRPYSKQLNSDKSDDVSCNKKKNTNFNLMIHQQIIRDYINLYSPYRGLLLYHGLGAGKTCSSIAIAEGMKTNKSIIIMTPASLRMNYINELKFCGDPLYKLNQYWEKISINENKHIEKALSEILGLDISFIRKQKGAWLVDLKKKSNFNSLSPLEQKSIDNQIDKMINKKYKFINYNGIREGHLGRLIEISKQKQGTSNPFDNKVIIIDEAHNFVSRIVNKISKKKTSLSLKL